MTSADPPAPSRGGLAEMFVRHPGNPIITAADLPRMVNAVFNPGATVFEGQTLLLLRVEDRTGLSYLVVARSPDGYGNWTVERDRGMFAQTSTFEEHWGVEDPRITRVGDEYLIVYTGFSTTGPLVLLASTRDFVHFDRRGVLQSPENKDAALLPTTFDGRWALIHRPTAQMPGLGAHIWLSWSPDLRHFGDSKVLLPARRGGWWDANTVGPGPPTDADPRRVAPLLPQRPHNRVGSHLPSRARAPRPRRPDPGDRSRQRVGVRSVCALRTLR